MSSNDAQRRSDAIPRRKAYEYSPLDASQHQIRLLKFRQQGDDIHCQMSVFDLRAAPGYRALSYTWGPPLPTFDIRINGKRHWVRENLYRFLLKFLETQPRDGYLWIDQLSIDQINVHERNHQVALMADIYKRAVAMIMWLGDTVGPSHIKKVSSHVLIEPDWPLPTISSLLRDSYFTRLWIVQEFLLSQRVEIVIAGEVQVDFLTISDAACTWNVRLRELQVPQSTLELFWFRPRRGRAKKYQDRSLVALFESFHGSTCMDPRDKVYGLLGLSCDNFDFPIDYSKSVTDVFLDAAMALYRTYRGVQTSLMEESKTITPGVYERSAKLMGTKEIHDSLEDYERKYRAWVLWRHRPTGVNFDDKAQSRYNPVNNRLHHHVLNILSREMMFDASQLGALHSMLWAIWKPMERENFDARGRPNFPPVTAIGFDERTDVRKSHESSQERIEPGPARWWYECRGKRHVFECTE